MPPLRDLGFKMRSNGFNLIRDMEKKQGKSMSVDKFALTVSLARATVRKFFDKPGADVSGVSLQAAQHIADKVGVPLSELVYKGKVDSTEPYEEGGTE